MQLIESYQPEYVACFAQLTSVCTCPACSGSDSYDPNVILRWKNEERQSLLLGCERACREILFNPQAFVLHTSEKPAQASDVLSDWQQQLNQWAINLVICPGLSVEQSLYGVGVLVGKAEQIDPTQLTALEQLNAFAIELGTLAEQGVLQQQFLLLPEIAKSKLEALAFLGTLKLSLSLPLAEKMPFMLKMSEMMIMPKVRLEERQMELARSWQERAAPFFAHHSCVLRNYLLYQLYHQVFPYSNGLSYSQSFRLLATDLFNLKTLYATWLLNHEALSEESVIVITSAYARWKTDENDTSLFLEAITTDENEDLLMGFSLL